MSYFITSHQTTDGRYPSTFIINFCQTHGPVPRIHSNSIGNMNEKLQWVTLFLWKRAKVQIYLELYVNKIQQKPNCNYYMCKSCVCTLFEKERERQKGALHLYTFVGAASKTTTRSTSIVQKPADRCLNEWAMYALYAVSMHTCLSVRSKSCTLDALIEILF